MRQRGFFGHPPGLGFLAFTEGWERFSFSGMQAMLVLYMVDQLLKPGHVEKVLGFAALRGVLEGLYGPLDPQPLSSVIFGLYTSLVFFMPVFGGIIGDRLVGQHRMVMTGALLMAAGHFMMAFEASFLIALLLLILGCGCLKGNIATQVSGLYEDGDRRRTDAFQIYSMSMLTGIIIAPLICGTLGEVYGWHYGFGAAGIGMLIGLVIYVLGRRHLPPDRLTTRASTGEPVLPPDRSVLVVLALVFLLTVAFLTAVGQLGNVYNLWLASHVDRHVGSGTSIPVTWFQSLTPLGTVLLTPLIMRRWQHQAACAREPALLPKMGIGLAIVTAGLLWLTLLTVLAGGERRVPWLLVLPVHGLVSVGYTYVYPVGLALFSRIAPPGGRTMLIGVFFLTSFVASNLVGWLGRYYQSMTLTTFWGLQSAILGGAALLALLLAGVLGRVLERSDGDGATVVPAKPSGV